MFDIGDVVFARFEGYPEWPAKVIPPRADHLFSLSMKKIPPNMRLVLFYNDNGKYAVMDVSDLRPIDDPRLQNRTRDYKGQFCRQLRVAFKSALRDHQPSKSGKIPQPPPSASPNHRKRPKKPAPSQPSQPSHPSHPTSPVSGHSDLPQSLLSQRANAPTKPPNSSPSSPQTSSKPISPSRSSTPPVVTSPTHLRASISTRPSRFRQSSPSSIPVKLRLRRKRRSTAADPALESPHSNLSSPSPVKTPVLTLPQPSTKRRRPDTDTEPNYTNQSQTEQSNGKHHDPPKLDTPTTLANAPRQACKPYTGIDAAKKTETPDANMPPTRKRGKIARSSSDQRSRRNVNDNRKVLKDPQKPARTDQFRPRLESENNADKTERIGRRHRTSKVKTVQMNHSDDDPIANGSSGSEQKRQSNDIRSSGQRGKSRQASNLVKVQDDDVKRETETDCVQKPSKRRKTDDSRESGSMAFEMLSKKDSSEVMERMMTTIRLLHVEKWRDGYKRARAGDMVRTEKEMSARCKMAIQKAEELLRIMEGDEGDKPEVAAKELEAFQAVRNMREIHFDVKTMDLRKAGRKMMSLGRELEPYSTKVWSGIRELLVMWADLTTEGANEDVETKDERTTVKKEKRNSDRKSRECKKETGGEVARNEKKELSAREERLMKFDRKTLLGAVDTILAAVKGDFELDERERMRFTRKVEEAIRPRFEDNRSGYYEASVKVMKGLTRAIKDVKAHGTHDASKRTNVYTKMFVSAVHDESGEKATQLVTRLLR